MIDSTPVIESSRGNVSNQPVKTARYMVEIVMNENAPDGDNQDHIRSLEIEFQRALDDGYFEEIRYDMLLFDVVSREVLDEAPANDPDE